jgi:hypothetical protein
MDQNYILKFNSSYVVVKLYIASTSPVSKRIDVVSWKLTSLASYLVVGDSDK